MLKPLRRFAISAAGSCVAARTISQPIWRTLRIQDRRIRLQHLVDGGGHTVLIMVERYRPTILLEIVGRVSHDHRMTGKGQHVDVVVVVTNSHDLAAIDATMIGPTLQRMSFRASGVEDVHDAEVAEVVLGAQGGEIAAEAAGG